MSKARKIPAHFHSSQKARGVAMLLVVITTGIALLIAFSYLAVPATATDISRNVTNTAQARAIAESGLTMAMSYVKNNTTWRTNRPQGAWVSNQTLNGGTFTVSGVDGADTNGDGIIDNGNTNFNDATHPVTLTATSTYKGAKYSLKAVMYPSAAQIQVGMSVLGTSGPTLTLSNGQLLDSYDSGLGSYGRSNKGSATKVVTNSPTAGTVSISGGSALDGSVFAPAGSNLSQIVSNSYCTYTGTTQTQTATVATPTITART